MKLKTLKNITKEAIGDRDGRVEFEIIKDPLYPEALCATIKDLREEAKLWRDEIRTGDLIQMPQFKLWMKEIPTKWEHNANFIYGFEWGFQTALNHFFNLKEEGEE